ncbi:MAG: DUF202 domain-containing protein [Nitrospirae bacterium]|nr:DUF202 domain-containing protein [Nitrospirota bacterium]
MFLKDKINEYSRAQAHMANERTFLSWIRTSMAVMAFGFVVEKFGLFMLKFTELLSTIGEKREKVQVVEHYSSKTGLLLIIIGEVIALVSFIKYMNTTRQIKHEQYYHSVILDLLMTIAIVIIAVLFTVHLIESKV